mgnify:FL=1
MIVFLPEQGLYDSTNSADAPQGVEPCKLGTIYGRFWDIIHVALSRAEKLYDQKLRVIIEDNSSRKVEVALWVERMLDPVRELMYEQNSILFNQKFAALKASIGEWDLACNFPLVSRHYVGCTFTG